MTIFRRRRANTSEELVNIGPCPTCGARRKVYKRKLNSGMAATLVVVYNATIHRNPRDGWLHLVKDFTGEASKTILGSKDYNKLRFWRLIEQKPGKTGRGRTSGTWRITEDGISFVRGEATVPMYVYERNSVVQGFSDGSNGHEASYVTIHDALEDVFDYDELMRDSIL